MSNVICLYISLLFSVRFVTNVSQNTRNIPVQVGICRKFHNQGLDIYFQITCIVTVQYTNNFFLRFRQLLGSKRVLLIRLYRTCYLLNENAPSEFASHSWYFFLSRCNVLALIRGKQGAYFKPLIITSGKTEANVFYLHLNVLPATNCEQILQHCVTFLLRIYRQHAAKNFQRSDIFLRRNTENGTLKLVDHTRDSEKLHFENGVYLFIRRQRQVSRRIQWLDVINSMRDKRSFPGKKKHLRQQHYEARRVTFFCGVRNEQLSCGSVQSCTIFGIRWFQYPVGYLYFTSRSCQWPYITTYGSVYGLSGTKGVNLI